MPTIRLSVLRNNSTIVIPNRWVMGGEDWRQMYPSTITHETKEKKTNIRASKLSFPWDICIEGKYIYIYSSNKLLNFEFPEQFLAVIMSKGNLFTRK